MLHHYCHGNQNNDKHHKHHGTLYCATYLWLFPFSPKGVTLLRILSTLVSRRRPGKCTHAPVQHMCDLIAACWGWPRVGGGGGVPWDRVHPRYCGIYCKYQNTKAYTVTLLEGGLVHSTVHDGKICSATQVSPFKTRMAVLAVHMYSTHTHGCASRSHVFDTHAWLC